MSSEVYENEKGGKQSRIHGRYDLLSPIALDRAARILAGGAKKYGEWNWHKIDSKDHLNHVLNHIFKYIAGDKSEDHLGNALCRMIFAVDRSEFEDNYKSPYEKGYWPKGHISSVEPFEPEEFRSLICPTLTCKGQYGHMGDCFDGTKPILENVKGPKVNSPLLDADDYEF